MYELSVSTHFSAAHHLEGYPGSCVVHHGHNWDVEVFVRGEALDATGLLVDFKTLKRDVSEAVGMLDHVDLNTVERFRTQNPTSEHIARFLYEEISRKVDTDRYRVHRVSVHETPGSCASYWPS
jgi:6-pyruvoyltetrahydropterin/6-carboxytetrahydropterin synthase